MLRARSMRSFGRCCGRGKCHSAGVTQIPQTPAQFPVTAKPRMRILEVTAHFSGEEGAIGRPPGNKSGKFMAFSPVCRVWRSGRRSEAPYFQICGACSPL